jgi:Protein kinase domain/PX domain
LIYAVTVTQPVQSWTVVRSHVDFQELRDAVMATLTTIVLPLFPTLSESDDTDDLNTVVRTRNDLQVWLTGLLSFPNVHSVSAISSFLTLGANMIPVQYESVAWTQFTPPPPSSSSMTHPTHQPNAGVNFDDMEMDDMFVNEDEIAAPHDDQDYEDAFIPASVRYKPTDEAFTDEEEMEILNLAATGEVEMIEDIGSLAQSLGASHLGRSLQLQAEIKFPGLTKNNVDGTQQNGLAKLQQGLNIGGSKAPVESSVGGLGSAMERAAVNSAHFNHRPPVSAPRLDSFKMIKVIGKGSFGKVFLVKEIKTNQIYALKVLRKDNIIKRNQVEHTNTERSVLGYVRHPFIVGMNMAFQSKDKLYFVLDYCAGGELFFHLGKLGKFPEHRARFYAAEIILAIRYVFGSIGGELILRLRHLT